MAMPNRKVVCGERREKMLSEKMDYVKFLTCFIEEWPKSGEAMKAAGSEFWSKFK